MAHLSSKAGLPTGKSWGMTKEQSQPVVVFSLAVMLTIAVVATINWQNLPTSALMKVVLSIAGVIGLFVFFQKVVNSALIAAACLALTLIFLPFLPFLVFVLYGMAILGWCFLRPEMRLSFNDSISILMLIVLGFETEFLNGFYFEGLLNAGLVKMDTLFHGAIAASYAHYGIPSIAIDGLLPVQYHVLSHKIFAGFSIFSQLELLEVYSYAFTSLAPTILVFVIAGFAKAIQPQLDFAILIKRSAALLLLVILPFIFKKVSYSHSILASESFLTAVIFSLLSFAALWKWLENAKANTPTLLLAFLFLCMAGMSKASLAVIDLAAFGFVGLFFARKLVFWAMIMLSVAVLAYALSGAASANASASLFDPLTFIATYSMSPKTDTMFTKTAMFLIMHFLAVWLCIAAGIYFEGVKYFRSREFCLLFSITGVALVVSVFLNFAAGANTYFSMVPMIVGLCFLATRWPMEPGRMFIVGKNVISSNQIASFVFSLFLLQEFRIHDHYYPKMLDEISKASDPEFASYIQQMRAFRAQLPRESEVKIENFELLTRKIGCTAFFLAPALLEHPISGGIPTEADCPEMQGAFGLGTYQNPETLVNSKHFPVQTLRLSP